MSSVWFTSDTHFGHRLMLTERNFDSIDAHDESIVDAWNSTVRPGDTVWHLGDVAVMGSNRVGPDNPLGVLLRRLHGEIHLVAGNHDPVHPQRRDSHRRQREWLGVFASIQSAARRRIDRAEVLLSHYPYTGDHTEVDRDTQWRLRDEGRWLLHGHTHSRQRVHGRQIHVGVDAWGRPVHADEIAEIIKESRC